MAFLGFGQEQPFAAAEQNAQDRQTAFQGIKDNLPALGLVMGLSMLARNNGTRSVGQLIGQGGADALNAYGTWQKIQEAKARQEMLDKERAEQREYDRSQDAFKNQMEEKKFGLDAMKTQQEMAMARARLGMEGARLAMARQAAHMARMDAAAKEEYDKTHRTGADGRPYVMRTGEDGKTYWEVDRDRLILGPNGEELGVKPPEPAKFTDVKGLADEWRKDSSTFLDMQRSAGSLLANAKEGSKTGDLAMVFNFMKTLDPRSVVREGEQQQARATGGITDQFIGYIDAIRGQGMLTPAQRAAFVRTARNMMAAEAKAQARRNAQYTDWARSYNINPANIIQNPYDGQLEEIDTWLAGQGTGPVAGGTPAVGAPQPPVVPGRSGSMPRQPGGPGGSASPSASALPPGFKRVN